MRHSWLAAGLLALAMGCGDGPATGTVTGEVTLEGKPVEAGTIRFIPADGKSPPAEAAITAGKYTADVPVGEVRIEISASKVVGKRKAYNTPDSPTVDITKEALPAKYNTKSELSMTVKRGSQEKSFPLTEK